MKNIKYLRVFIIGISLLIEVSFSADTPLTFIPFFSTNYYSTGSILHPEQDGGSILTHFQLGGRKVTGPWSISGYFRFITATNLDLKSTYLNPGLSLEHERGYQNTDDTWFESSSLMINYNNNEKFSTFFGKDRVNWGIGRSNLIVSNNCPTYPVAGFDLKISNKLYLEYFIGSLHSQIEDTTSTYYKGVGKRKVYFPRSIAGHRLRYSLTDRISFSAIETVIFGNRKIDEHYLLPFIPFWSMQHSIGDLDNVQMCGELIWSGQNDLNIYASLFVDEWRPEWTFKDNNRNWIGYQIGMKKNKLLKENDQFLAEYTWTDHRVYRHKFPINDSYSYNYSLGFWAGPHAEELLLYYNLKFDNWGIESSVSHVKHGELTKQMLDGQYKDLSYSRYSGNTESRTIFSSKINKRIVNNKLFISVEGQWIDWENAGFDPYNPEISGKDISKFSINIELSVSTQIFFN